MAAAASTIATITPSRAAAASSPAAVAAVGGSQALALAVGLGLVLIWGANYSVQKLTFPVIGPDGLLFIRYLIMPAMAIALLWHRFGVDWPPVEKADRWQLVKLAMAGHVLHVGLVIWGIHLSTAFSSAVMSAVGPLFTLLILRLSGSAERLGAAKLAGVGVALAGILVFLSDKLLSEGWQAGWGDLVLLVAAYFFSYYTVAARGVIERIGGMPVMCYTTLIASPLMVVVSWKAGTAVDWTSVDWTIWVAVLWAIVVSAFFGWVLWGWVNAVRGVARTAPLMYLTPVVAGVVAWVALGEQFTVVKSIGAALTLAGVALAQANGGWRLRRARRAGLEATAVPVAAVVEQPLAAESLAIEPLAVEPVANQPVTDRPVTDRPVALPPPVGQPGPLGQPGATDPAGPANPANPANPADIEPSGIQPSEAPASDRKRRQRRQRRSWTWLGGGRDRSGSAASPAFRSAPLVPAKVEPPLES